MAALDRIGRRFIGLVLLAGWGQGGGITPSVQAAVLLPPKTSTNEADRVVAGGAEYGAPGLQRTFDLWV